MAEERGMKFAIVELHSEPLDVLERSGVLVKIGSNMIFDDMDEAVTALSANTDSPAFQGAEVQSG